MDETIFALSSGRVPAGVAVIRVSGPQTRFVVETISSNLPPPRKAVLRTFRDGNGDILDKGLVLFFPGPQSFTGEDCAEFHLHGGAAVVEAMFVALQAVPHCRLAEAGEFSRRAYANGKFDLTAAEGLADLIAAETESQRRLALLLASGAQAELYAGWREELLRARALIEAELDFADEADVPGSVSEQVWQSLDGLSARVKAHIESGRRGSVIRDGYRIVILGAPNAGKSSLLNALAGSEVAIVSDEAGTTRDLIEVRLDLDGVATIITDTAGLRETTGKVERIGIERAQSRAAEADLRLVLFDSVDPLAVDMASLANPLIRIGTKADLATKSPNTPYDMVVSTRTGHGMDELITRITNHAVAAAGNLTDPLPTRRRHLDLLASTLSEIEEAVSAVSAPLEVRAEYLRRASHALGRITGDIGVEDILDVVFSQFCIGK
ncbi:tRNA uridine-5-carboxymethylaminomethyl(34) synthesis GTPase MnmE [Phyllobacterium sp. 21LDTY02-6]|uniref:tRNA uridine-5-carboxymethylaminomethyl(34) synthesis GTPase MnmE n=1 Tax=Phyllobacterium sp. 21LDTY02-6 TaxID=2944903 RepID=UPI00202260E5|nr:tRNA uridine-5-carboxymethylaminomethyl(34) synthesis GTPase MnmE [Phyllobacterium sp. 21LDTY02-6]MCO4317314.1 tRNA uridine-5-carboxymethylaminomethyl(34) synthesis GTPase MnmE [Phyllobacterium sp. 21LDTY02-6]